MSIRNRVKQIRDNVSTNIQKDKKSAYKKLKKIGRGRTRRDYRRATRSALPPQKERDTWNMIGGGYGGGWGILFGPPQRRRYR